MNRSIPSAPWRCLLGASLVLMFGGCRATHLVYVQDVSLGIDASVTGEGVSKLMFGFDRNIFALVPKKGTDGEAMTLTSFSNVYAKGLDDIKFHHVVATGAAAKALAKSPATLKTLRKTVNEEH